MININYEPIVNISEECIYIEMYNNRFSNYFAKYPMPIVENG